MMDQEKPFKTIEVVDSRTKQVCKVACMSCIRGHRTTSCGIPVCRTKIFWTVKRPGRPSNSCTCRFGATGGCKCVVAKSACPHKSKKGEKRTGECRCDEQGRYCCLIESDQWTTILALQKPTVDFYQTREALEMRHLSPGPISMSYPQTPSFASSSPHPLNGLSNMPTPSTPIMQSTHNMTPGALGYFRPPPTASTPHFGIMDFGTPQTVNAEHDMSIWDQQTPTSRSSFNNTPYSAVTPPTEQRSCCQQMSPSAPIGLQSPHTQLENLADGANHMHTSLDNRQLFAADQTIPGLAAPTPMASTFDFDRLQADYFRYQFPSAICQNCGLNGCTCRNCPPVFQNFGTSTWAQYCGRKHARDVQPTPPPVAAKVARAESWTADHKSHHPAHVNPSLAEQTFLTAGAFAAPDQQFHNQLDDLHLTIPTESAGFQPFEDMGSTLGMPDATGQFDLSEMLLSDLNQAGRDDFSGLVEDSEHADDDGGGGCCCSGG